jgi:hypothetical protein
VVRLLVVLASPPTTSGVRTLNRVQDAAAVLGAMRVAVANLYTAEAGDLPALSQVATDPAGWLAARSVLASELHCCDAVLAAWGLHELNGTARVHRRAQLRWLHAQAVSSGHKAVWSVDGEPRHPSRWHQYVSDRHGRTGGGDFRARLREVLVQRPLGELMPVAFVPGPMNDD